MVEITIQMFCLDCGNALRNIHQLKENALKSYEKLQQGNYAIDQAKDSQDERFDQNQQTTKKRKRRGIPRMCAYCCKYVYM